MAVVPIGVSIVAAICFALLSILGCLLRRSKVATEGTWNAEPLTICAVLLAIVSVFAAWHHSYWRLYASDDICFMASDTATPVLLTVKALESPRVVAHQGQSDLQTLPDQTQSILNALAVSVGTPADEIVVSGRVEMRITGQSVGIKPGDMLRVYGKLQRPVDSMNPGEFSPLEYARSRRTVAYLAVTHPSAITRIGSASSRDLRLLPARMREYGQAMLWRYLPDEHARLAAALLLGERLYLEKERTDAFLHTGTIHLLAISGLHVNILALAFYFAARSAILPPRLALRGGNGCDFDVCNDGRRARACRASHHPRVCVLHQPFSES